MRAEPKHFCMDVNRMAKDNLTVRASWWSITLNNPTEQDRQTVRSSPPRWLKMIKGQDEIAPGTGTLHMQMVANTDQVRMSAICNWLKKAHVKAAFTREHIANLKTYCSEEKKKNDSFVVGTQFEIKYREENEHLTMADALVKLAELAYTDEKFEKMLEDQPSSTLKKPGKKLMEELYEIEYWAVVELLLLENPNAVALYTQPQYLRAWVKTRRVWIMKVEQDRQTKDVENNPGVNLM